MLSVIIVIHLMLVLGLIGVVLLQKSEGGGLVSSTSGFMTGRGTANVLTRTTAFLAAGFFVTSLLLSWIAGFERKPSLDHPHRRRAGPGNARRPACSAAHQRRWRRSRPAQEGPGRQHGAGASSGPGRTASAAVAIGDFATHLRLQRAGRATTFGVA